MSVSPVETYINLKIMKRARGPRAKTAQHTGLDLALAVAGSRHRLALKLGISPVAVHKWREIPLKRVLEVERITGIDREKLRPDIFRRS